MGNKDIRVFKASDDIDSARKYLECHNAILDEFKVRSHVENSGWENKDSVYLIVLEEQDTKEILGGARLHLYTKKDELPIASVAKKIDISVGHFLKSGVAEICGLFLIRSARRRLYLDLIVDHILEISDELNLKELICAASKHSFRSGYKFGFKHENSIGESSVIPYPCENEFSFFLRCDLAEHKRLELPKINSIGIEEIYKGGAKLGGR